MKRQPKIAAEPLEGANVDIAPSEYRKRLLKSRARLERQLDAANARLERARQRLARLQEQEHDAQRAWAKAFAEKERLRHQAELLRQL